MKNNLAFLLLLTLTLMSFSKVADPNFDTKKIKKDFVRVNETLFVSKFEVSNEEFRSFLADLASENQMDKYNICLPDTSVWKTDLSNAEALSKYYFRDSNYDNFPIVGISYEAANEYCKWLTEKYNQSKNKVYKEVQFKLLSKEEWIFAANKGNTSKVYTWGSGFLKNNRNQDLCNFKHTIFSFDSAARKYIELPDTTKGNNDVTVTTAPVESYYPNSFGIFNMCGNVAEMIDEKGIAKGGGFDDTGYNVRIASEKTYTKPRADLGFRIAMKIIAN